MTRMLEVEEIMAILPATIGRLRALTAGIDDATLHAAPGPDAWSVRDVLAHLLACNDVLGGNMLRIVREEHPAWRAMSPRTWQAKSGYHGRSFQELFDALVVGRRELLAAIEGWTQAAWDRTASVTVPPKRVFEYTTRYYGDWLAAHERAHLRALPQIIATVRARGAEDVVQS